MTDAEAIMRVLTSGAAQINPQRIQLLVEKIAKANKKHSNGEVIAALCFHLHHLVQRLPPDRRAGFLSALVRLIEPDQGST